MADKAKRRPKVTTRREIELPDGNKVEPTGGEPVRWTEQDLLAAAASTKRITVELSGEEWATWKAIAGLRAMTMREWLISALVNALTDPATHEHVQRVAPEILMMPDRGDRGGYRFDVITKVVKEHAKRTEATPKKGGGS
jgi:hypothetical protein